MKKIRTIFLFLFICVFFAISNVYGQDTINPHYLDLFNQSLVSLLANDYADSISKSTEVIRRYPNLTVSYVVRARAYFELGYYDNAIEDCNQALKTDANNVGAYSIRASSYAQRAQRGDLNRAIADWQRVLRLSPENEEARKNIELARHQSQ
jgi:tetratricopeptide (TPR) repeat protein